MGQLCSMCLPTGERSQRGAEMCYHSQCHPRAFPNGNTVLGSNLGACVLFSIVFSSPPWPGLLVAAEASPRTPEGMSQPLV